MDWTIRKIIAFFLKQQAIDPDDVDVYEYGLYILLSDIIDFGITFLLALVFGQLVQTLLYYVAFISLRRCAGGYHASTRLRCFAISMVAWALSMWLIHISGQLLWLMLAFAVLTVVLIFLFAPVENNNNPQSLEELLRHRRHARRLVVCLCVAVFAAALLTRVGLPSYVAASLAYGMVFFGGSLVVARLAKQRLLKKAQ